MAICKNCDDWHVRPDDVFCARCGVPTLAFEFLDGSNSVRVNAEDEWVQVKCHVRNTGQSTLELEIKKQAAGDRSATFEGLPLTADIAPRQETTLEFKAKFMVLRDDVLQREIRVYSQADGVSGVISFFKFALPKIEVEFDLGSFSDRISDSGEVLLTGRKPVTGALTAWNEGGSSASLLVVESPPWLAIAPGPYAIPPVGEIKIACTVEPGALKDTFLQGTVTVAYSEEGDPDQAGNGEELEIESPTFLIKSPARARLDQVILDTKLRTPKYLPIDPARNNVMIDQLMPSERRRQRFRLFNDGELQLPVSGIFSSYRDGDSAFAVRFDQSVTEVRPMEGEFFHISIDGALHEAGATRNVPIEVECGANETARFSVSFSIADRHPYPGYVALDFGTSNSCIAGFDQDARAQGPPRAFPIPEFGLYIPSVAYFFTPEDYVVGEEAVEWYRADPQNGVSSIKRGLLGEGRTIRNVTLSPEYLVGVILRDLISRASGELNHVPSKLVLTVPVGFSQRQRAVILRAARSLPGIEVDRVVIVEEPTAAAMHYLFLHQHEFSGKEDKRVLVFDFGGGTLDVAVLNVSNSWENFGILARRGDAALGGIDLDRLIAMNLVDSIRNAPDFSTLEREAVRMNRRPFNTRFRTSRRWAEFLGMRQRFQDVARTAKESLSKEQVYEYEIPTNALLSPTGDRIQLPGNTTAYTGRLTQSTLSAVIGERIERSVKVVQNALDAAGLAASDIDVVLLTGQVSRIPAIRASMRAFFPESTRIPGEETFDPKLCVALGAARLARDHASSNLDRSVGKIGYTIDSVLLDKPFVPVLPDGFHFGQFYTEPMKIKLNRSGCASVPLKQNQQKSDIMSDASHADFTDLGELHLNLPDRASAGDVNVFLGLDVDGGLVARLDDPVNGVNLSIDTPAEATDDEW
jgi:molecular chaperone DnaK (HSP70)